MPYWPIVIIDLALSGDNAAVIGLAIRELPVEQRKIAAVIGAGPLYCECSSQL